MFVRTVLYLLVAVFLLTLLRYFIGAIGKAFSDLLQPRSPSGRTGAGRASGPETGSELKKDPVCGTFVAASASVKKVIRGEVLHFCSEKCRDKYGESKTE